VRELFGATFPELVTSVKLREGARFLSSTDHPIGEVAAMVGYKDQNYFSRLFRRQFGLSPRSFRRRYPADV
jgi:two-component system, response regulator YesN